MPLRRATLPTLALILTAAFTACIADTAKTASLARALRVQYPTARMDIGFAGTRHLVVTVDDSSKRTLSDSALRTQGRSIAHFVLDLDLYPAATDLDSITIM